MKLKLTFILILINVAIIKVWPQGYMSVFGKDSTQWYQSMEIIDGDKWIYLKTVKDTVINSLDYVKVNVTPYIYYSDYCYIREDTITGKVWILDADFENEYLLMDMDLEVGDKFQISNINPNQDSIAIVTDIYFEDTIKIIELDYTLRNWCVEDHLTFIEGIGPNAGFAYQLENLDDNIIENNLLLCAYKDGVQVFKSEYANDGCGFVVCASLDETECKSLAIYPNPARNSVMLNLKDNFSGSLMLYNSIGSLIKSIPVIDSCDRFELDISDLNKGLYFILNITDTRLLEIGSFLKE